jgi:hypothetical protein
VLADRYLPRFSDRWTTEHKAQHALEYAVRLLDRGLPGEPGASRNLAT